MNDVIKQLLSKQSTPFFIFDINAVEQLYKDIKRDNTTILYAIKANPLTQLIKKLYDLGSSFDVASKGEIDELLSLGITGDRISYGNPNKKIEDIKYAYNNGVMYY
ncbi:MAG: hypothetical protein QXV17_07510 [Candidatus Micrarchaeaceae archaeon]